MTDFRDSRIIHDRDRTQHRFLEREISWRAFWVFGGNRVGKSRVLRDFVKYLNDNAKSKPPNERRRMALYINCLDSADESLATSIKSALVDRLLKDFRPDFGRVVALLLDKDASEHVYYALAAFVEITQAAAMEPVLVPDQAFEYLLEEGNPKPTTPAAITAIEQLSHHTHKVTVFLSLAERAFLHAIHDAQQVIFSISRRSSSQMGLVLAIVAVAILKRALSFFVSSCIIDTNMEECGEIMLKDEDHIEYCQTCAPTP